MDLRIVCLLTFVAVAAVVYADKRQDISLRQLLDPNQPIRRHRRQLFRPFRPLAFCPGPCGYVQMEIPANMTGGLVFCDWNTWFCCQPSPPKNLPGYKACCSCMPNLNPAGLPGTKPDDDDDNDDGN